MGEINFYKYSDLKFDELNKMIVRRFNSAKREVKKKKYKDNFQTLSALYKKLDADARYHLKQLVSQQYRYIGKEIGLKELDDEFEDLFLENILTAPDPITLYSYESEVYRKRDRAVEGTDASHKTAELDKSMRLWSQMVGQYADNVSYMAAVKAYEDAGIKYVRWVTQRDDRVCNTCEERDGRIYPVAALPTRPHWRCRCWFY